MNKTQTLKYWRIADDKKSLILLPSKVGLEIIKTALDKQAFTETVETIGKSSLIALKVEFTSEWKYVEYKVGISNLVSLYIFFHDESKFYLTFAYEV